MADSNFSMFTSKMRRWDYRSADTFQLYVEYLLLVAGIVNVSKKALRRDLFLEMRIQY